MYNNPVSFIKVTTNIVIDFITAAKRRIIFAKPSFLKKEIEAIIDTKKLRNIFIEVYMEAGEDAVRYGFGETSALKLIHGNLEMFNIYTANRIRIAVLVIDDRALVYMPNLAFIEEELSELSFPNGFLCNKNVTEDIVSQFEAKDTNNIEIDNVDNVIIFPGVHIPLLKSNEIINGIKNSIEILDQNPAVDPAKLKKVNFYRNNYKIVKMQILGVRINNKSLSIKPFYSLLPNVNERIKSSWNVITSKDVDELQSTKLFEKELDKIKDQFKEYLFDAGRFGSIIDVKKKDEFIKSINKLKSDFKSYLKNEPNEEAKKRFENKNQKSDLKTILDKSKVELESYLLKLCPEFKEFKEKIFSEYRNLKMEYEYGQKNEEEIMKEYVSLFVLNKLKFTDVDELIERIDIKLDWYDVSDELLFDNEDFKEVIEKYGLELRKNSVGYERNVLIPIS